MFRLLHVAERHLMRAPIAFGFLSIHLFRAGPSLGAAQHDHGPERAIHQAALARFALNIANLGDHRIENSGHECVHDFRLVTFHKIRLVAITREQTRQLFPTDAGEYGRTGDFIAVEMQDGQYSAVRAGIEKFVGMPRSGQRPGFRFSVANHATGNEIGVIKHRAIRMEQRIAQLSSLIDGTRCLRCGMARYPARERKLPKQLPHAFFVPRNIRIQFAIRAFEICVGHHSWAAVARASDKKHVEAMRFDNSVHMHVDKVEPRCSTPVAQQAWLDVRQLQWHF